MVRLAPIGEAYFMELTAETVRHRHPRKRRIANSRLFLTPARCEDIISRKVSSTFVYAATARAATLCGSAQLERSPGQHLLCRADSALARKLYTFGRSCAPARCSFGNRRACRTKPAVGHSPATSKTTALSGFEPQTTHCDCCSATLVALSEDREEASHERR